MKDIQSNSMMSEQEAVEFLQSKGLKIIYKPVVLITKICGGEDNSHGFDEEMDIYEAVNKFNR